MSPLPSTSPITTTTNDVESTLTKLPVLISTEEQPKMDSDDAPTFVTTYVSPPNNLTEQSST